MTTSAARGRVTYRPKPRLTQATPSPIKYAGIGAKAKNIVVMAPSSPSTARTNPTTHQPSDHGTERNNQSRCQPFSLILGFLLEGNIHEHGPVVSLAALVPADHLGDLSYTPVVVRERLARIDRLSGACVALLEKRGRNRKEKEPASLQWQDQQQDKQITHTTSHVRFEKSVYPLPRVVRSLLPGFGAWPYPGRSLLAAGGFYS